MKASLASEEGDGEEGMKARLKVPRHSSEWIITTLTGIISEVVIQMNLAMDTIQ